MRSRHKRKAPEKSRYFPVAFVCKPFWGRTRGDPENNAARTVTTGPHHESRCQTAPHRREGFGTVRPKRREASRQARLCGTHPGKHDRGEKPKGIGVYKPGRTGADSQCEQYGPVHGHAGTCSSARPRRRKEDPSIGPIRPTPVRPQMEGRLVEHVCLPLA
jgi:hypothetical protein